MTYREFKPGSQITARQIAKMIDHSLLKPDITIQDIIEGCNIAMKCDCATISTNSSVIPVVREALKGSDVRYGTVISFPHGYESTEIKKFATERAIEDGCTELDMIMNVQRLKSKEYDYVKRDVEAVVNITKPAKVLLKVLLETNFLTEDEIITASKLVSDAGADFIKCNSGFPGGAKIRHLKLMRESAPPHVMIKVAGGVRTLDNLLAAISVGAAKLGATATETIVSEAIEREKQGPILIPETVPEDLY